MKPVRLQPIHAMQSADKKSEQHEGQNDRISLSLEENIAWVQKYFSQCSDLLIRRFFVGSTDTFPAVICYLDGMTESTVVNEAILGSLQNPLWNVSAENAFSFVVSHLLGAGETRYANSLAEGVQAMMQGDVLLLLENNNTGVLIDAKGFPHRTIGAPRNEKSIRGSQEAFVEAMRVNTALLRRRIHTGNLKLEQMTLGAQTQTQITIAYITDVANKTIIDEVTRRLNRCKDMEYIINTTDVEAHIQERPFSIFPQVRYTERPDEVALALFKGRVAIFVDGSPDVMLLPISIPWLLTTAEDADHRIWAGAFVRWIRYIGIFVATTLPSLYVAVVSFHPELLPLRLLLSIAAAREGVPFPIFLEAILMEIAFELLREASIRMPGAIGNTIGIVGALVIGDAAVSARLVSPQMVIVVALTAIGSFAVPSVSASDSVRMIRFPLLLLAASFGLYGVILGWLALLFYLVRLRPFGIPYLPMPKEAQMGMVTQTNCALFSWKKREEARCDLQSKKQ